MFFSYINMALGTIRIDLLAFQRKSLELSSFLYIFIREVRSSGVRASNIIVHIEDSTEFRKISFDSNSFVE